MLNKIILTQIKHQSQNNVSHTNAMISDVFEEPATYEGWIYPLRYLLALRYLKQKEKILAWFRSQKVYPILDEDFQTALLAQLSGKQDFTLELINKKSPLTSLGFKAVFVYPTLLASFAFGLYSFNDWYQQRRIENVLANHLPYYTDLLHRKLLLTHNNGHSSVLKKVEANITREQNKILSNLPAKNGIRELMAQQLKKLKDPATDSEDIMLGFKAVNTLFDQKGLSFYLSPKSFSMPCSSLIDAPVEELMMLKQLESLMSNDNPERCRTTMMTSYKVSKRNQLFYEAEDNGDDNKQSTELPLFHVQRIDKVPAVDSALGLTFKERGIGSIILTKRIQNFGRESILPALTFQGRSYVIPYWMQGYYDIEESVTKGYKKDLNSIYPKNSDRLKVKSTIKKLIKDKARLQNTKLQQTLRRTNSNDNTSLFGNGFDAISVLLGKQEKANNKQKKAPTKLVLSQSDLELLDKLDAVLLPSIEYHEAYHQIDKKTWVLPAWTKITFKDENLTKNGLDHTMEELGAYLAQIANTKEGHNIWLSKLLIFSLSPFTKGQAESYASSIILTTMDSIYLNKEVAPYFETDVDSKNQIYQQLISMSNSQKRLLAKKAYEILFEREVPKLHY
jgi:hypothetical protein